MTGKIVLTWVLTSISQSSVFIYATHYQFIEAFICDALRDLVLVVVCSLKNVKNSDGGVSLFVKSQASGSNSTKSNTPP